MTDRHNYPCHYTLQCVTLTITIIQLLTVYKKKLYIPGNSSTYQPDRVVCQHDGVVYQGDGVLSHQYSSL